MRTLDMTGGSISRHTHAADAIRSTAFCGAQAASISTAHAPAATMAPAQPNWRLAANVASRSVIEKNSATVSSMMV